MKKYFIVCAAFLFASTVLSAQVVNGPAPVSKDSLMKLMAKETCEEIAKKDLSNKTMEELEMELGLAMMPVVLKYQEALKTSGYDMEDQQGMMNMGKEVGMQLAKDCPAFLKMFVNNPGVLKEALDKKETIGKEKMEVLPANVFGTLVKIVPGDISHIQVKDGTGKIQKLWWMEYFEGSNKLISEPAKFLNKTVQVSYVEKEIYNSTLKDYVKVKIITGIE